MSSRQIIPGLSVIQRMRTLAHQKDIERLIIRKPKRLKMLKRDVQRLRCINESVK